MRGFFWGVELRYEKRKNNDYSRFWRTNASPTPTLTKKGWKTKKAQNIFLIIYVQNFNEVLVNRNKNGWSGNRKTHVKEREDEGWGDQLLTRKIHHHHHRTPSPSQSGIIEKSENGGWGGEEYRILFLFWKSMKWNFYWKPWRCCWMRRKVSHTA